MSKPLQFLTLLYDLTNARHMDVDELAHEMDLPRHVAQSWLCGWSTPSAEQLPALAKALAADLLDVSFAWMFDQAPELEDCLYDAVLVPRGTKVLHSSDLALLGPKRRPRVASFDVSDPHDLPIDEASGGA